MHKRIITAGLTLVSFSLLGGMAYAVTQSVSTRPSPQVVIPAVRSDARTTATTVEDGLRGTATTSGHDGTDDHTAATTPTTGATGTTGTTGTTSVTVTTLAGGDDRGRGRSGLDDGVNHDANDDRVVTTVPTTSVPGTIAPATTVADGRHVEPGDDRGGSGSSGPSTPATSPSSNSGKGSSGSGSDSGSSSGKSGKDG